MPSLQIPISQGMVLKTWEEASASPLFSLVDRNREYLSTWLPWVPFVKDEKDSLQFILDSQVNWEKQQGLELGIWREAELVGCIGLHELNRLHNRTSIGYWLGAEYQGQGIMTIAVATLVDFCFHDLQFHRVEIRAAVENIASRAIPQRLGFAQEGILREAELVDGRYLASVVYSKLNTDSEVESPIGA